MDKNKDDYVMRDFVIGEGLWGEDIDNYVYERRNDYYSLHLNNYLDRLTDVSEGIIETKVYTNYAKNRWEYWGVLTTDKTVGLLSGFQDTSKEFVSFCDFKVNSIGFGKWMSEIEEYIVNETIPVAKSIH